MLTLVGRSAKFVRSITMAYLFRKPARVKKRADFLRIQDQGRKSRSYHFVMMCLPRKEEQDSHQRSSACSRLGVTVTTKVDKRAVGRNLVKRRWREFFRTRKGRISPGWDLVVIALTGASELSHEEFITEAYFLLRKSGLWLEKSPRPKR